MRGESAQTEVARLCWRGCSGPEAVEDETCVRRAALLVNKGSMNEQAKKVGPWRWPLALLIWFLGVTAVVAGLVGCIDLGYERSVIGGQLIRYGFGVGSALMVVALLLKPGAPREGSRLFAIAFGWWPFAAFAFFIVWRSGVSGEQKVACDAGDGDACFRLGERWERRDREPDARVVFETGCDGAHAECCVALGSMREYGRGGEVDLAGAAASYEVACNLPHALACSRLGSMYRDGRGVVTDLERARLHFDSACNLGQASACEASRLLTSLPVVPP